MIDLHVVYYSMPGLLLSRKVCDMQCNGQANDEFRYSLNIYKNNSR